ncbi:MAG: hypothetical protein KJ749_05525, partial [Planctomycetes bacterium]|nr:hypothetical protein [Planctomycetota bacterium]
RGETWADSSCRIAAMNKKQIHRELRDGVITAAQAKRRLRCTPPNSRLHKHYRRSCHHHGCPWCRYRMLLATFRGLHHHVVEPERRARGRKGRARTGMRNRLVLCQVKITTPREVSIESTVRSVVDEQLLRKIQRAGGIHAGLATTSINDLTSTTVVTVSVLGISQEPVHHLQPDVCVSLDARVAAPRMTPPGLTVDDAVAFCEALPDISVETTWQAAVRGHDCPLFGPASLLRLLAPTMPRTKDATGIRAKRFQPLGTWKKLLGSRMAMPGPIIYQRFRPHVVEVPVKLDRNQLEMERNGLQSQLAKMEGLVHTGADIAEAVSSPEEDFSASFRYAFAVRAGLPDIASQFRDQACRELRQNKDRLDAMKPLLPEDFVRDVYDAMGKWRDDPEVRQTRRYWRVKWHKDPSALARRHDQLVRAILRGVMRLCGRKLGFDKELVNMAIGWTVNEQRAYWMNDDNPNGYFDLNDVVLPRLRFPRRLLTASIARCLDEPLAAVDGYLPPPEVGGPLWGQITDRLDVHHDPEVAFVIRPPGRTREVAVIHQDADATAFGKANRIGRSQYFIQSCDNYLEFCWEIWKNRPDDKSDLFESVA